MERNKYRILHVIPNFFPGGAERLVVELMSAFDKTAFKVAAVSLYPKSETILDREIYEKGLEVFYLNKRLGFDIRMFKQLYDLFYSFKPDVVHTHLSVLRYALPPMMQCKIPVRVHTVHSIAQNEIDRFGRIIHRYAFRFAGVVPVGISREVAETIKMIYGQDIQVPVVYNGVFTTKYCMKEKVKERKESNTNLIHVGSFKPAKNHHLLIEAFGLAIKECPDLRLWLVGDGPALNDVRDHVKRKGLSDYVSFLGTRDDVPDLLAASDIFVLSSDWEGMPLAVIEAMAAGKPVIATCVGAIPEMVRDGVEGLIVPPGDKEAIVNAILRLTLDSNEREQMGRAASRRAKETFDISRTAEEYEALYLNFLKNRR